MERDIVEQKVLRPFNGMIMLVILLALSVFSVVGFIYAIYLNLIPVCVALWIILPFLYGGLRVVRPNEALVLTLFGKYHGTIMKPGFFFVNPFSRYNNPVYETEAVNIAAENVENFKKGKGSAKKNVALNNTRKTISLKRTTLDNGTQKVNDALGNPVIIGAVVLWHVEDPTKAVFNVENYTDFLSIQTDTTIRNTARLYPYDIFDDGLQEENGETEQTLRGSAQEIALKMKAELAEKVKFAGLVIEEVRITHLSYAEEIAAAMLQRQQAAAIISARSKIVDGAVSMVKMALDKLDEDEIVILDDERRAQMISNLLVVLCGNKEAQPIVNSGSLF